MVVESSQKKSHAPNSEALKEDGQHKRVMKGLIGLPCSGAETERKFVSLRGLDYPAMSRDANVVSGGLLNPARTQFLTWLCRWCSAPSADPAAGFGEARPRDGSAGWRTGGLWVRATKEKRMDHRFTWIPCAKPALRGLPASFRRIAPHSQQWRFGRHKLFYLLPRVRMEKAPRNFLTADY